MSLSGVVYGENLIDATLAGLTVAGAQLTADLVAACTDASLEESIQQASTLTLTFEDPTRSVLRSPLFASQVTATVDGHEYILVQLAKTGHSFAATFENSTVNALRFKTGQRSAAPGTMTRVQFAQLLVSELPGATLNGWPNAGLIQEQLTRGTSTVPDEDTWTCLTRLASEVGWECFAVGSVITFGPDSWLVAQPAVFTAQEMTGPVDFIDFDWDQGKPIAQATVQAYGPRWSVTPGQVVTLANMGIATGSWIVADRQRSLLYTPTTITVTAPQPSIPEPSGTTATAATMPASTAAALGTPSPSTGAAKAVQYAEAELGVPYRWGGENPATGFDCSGLVQYAFGLAGIKLPRVAQDQFNGGTTVASPFIPGDLFFFGTSITNITHVGIYLGGGMMIDAPHTGANVRTEPVPTTIGAMWGSGRLVGVTRPA